MYKEGRLEVCLAMKICMQARSRQRLTNSFCGIYSCDLA